MIIFPVSRFKYDFLIEKITLAIKSNHKLVVNYLNFYSVLEGINNKKYYEALVNADIIHPDGTGTWLTAKIFGLKNIPRYNFTDYASEYISYCERQNWSIFFIGGTESTINKAVNNIKVKFPKLIVKGFSNGYDFNQEEVLDLIKNSQPDILFVGLGLLKQEPWIYNNKNVINAKVIHAVGDLINYFAGEKHRGPKFLRAMGLEWFVRVLTFPRQYFYRYIFGIPSYLFALLTKKFQLKIKNE